MPCMSTQAPPPPANTARDRIAGRELPRSFGTTSSAVISDHMSDALVERELASVQGKLTPRLYHYTSSEAAILGILANRTIRLAPFRGTNDLWESRPLRPNLVGDLDESALSHVDTFSIWEDLDRYIRGYSKVACFTQDWELPDTVIARDAYRGWGHLSLWAHYGASHAGVCLEFNRERLIAALEAAGGNAIHQFYGPVRYRRAEFGAGPHGISIAQAAEFGIDAVALRYARVHHERIFFRKHADWASESEFRLVRTDLSTEPYYLDITDSLTGIVLGDAFPRDRIPGLLTMLAQFGDVSVEQARYHGRTLQLVPMVAGEGDSTQAAIPAITATIPPRRSGDLAERLGSLEDAERVDRAAASKAAAPVLQEWGERLERSGLFANWPNVAILSHPQSRAIPQDERGGRPGVPGEVVAYEAGLMVVGEHQPQYSFTWLMAIAVQVMPSGKARLHACIRTERWRSEGNLTEEHYRDRHDTTLDELVEASRQVLARLLEAVPDARARFDEMRGEPKQAARQQNPQ